MHALNALTGHLGLSTKEENSKNKKAMIRHNLISSSST
jgi:hypothetical protein